ncbi:protein of unknown function [Methylobacterium sp. ap11]|uniref:eCIS core domain-containing protein n=1 Tax=Methylobacterium sp. ap11 TaxID=1761799 RepID=UPI0008AE969A|nr:DUF4157 domain-containing protein [Methylobacterium sp. ap11]SEP49467.1 protein of unknown function [Methylobacterium sp. ap11]
MIRRNLLLFSMAILPSTVLACDPNENCRRCLISAFGNCIKEGNDPICEARKKTCQIIPQLVDTPGSPFGPGGIAASGGPVPLRVLKTCAENITSCPSAVVAQLSYEAVRPIVDSYRAHLSAQANGKWKSLPKDFIDAVKSYYLNVNLDNVRYAENIYTIHGQAITIGDEIFIPSNMDLGQPDGKRLMLHELQHVVQYQRRGGPDPFLAEYIAKSIGKIAERRSFNVHDYIDLENEANKKAEEVYNSVRAFQPQTISRPSVGGGVAKYYNPQIQNRTIDACIKSNRFSENTGTQCTKSAQQHIADAFCANQGRSTAIDWTDTFTGVFQRSVKYVNDQPGSSTGQWRNDDRGGAIFTSISCS